MPLVGILLGLINIFIVLAILVLIGCIIVWILGIFGFPIPAVVQKLFMAIVALIALYMLVALLLGAPQPWKFVKYDGPIGATSIAPPSIIAEKR